MGKEEEEKRSGCDVRGKRLGREGKWLLCPREGIGKGLGRDWEGKRYGCYVRGKGRDVTVMSYSSDGNWVSRRRMIGY